jgi:hypothetical protein
MLSRISGTERQVPHDLTHTRNLKKIDAIEVESEMVTGD